MSFIDPLLDWILIFSPLVSIIIVSVIIGVITTLIYKYVTDQKKIKSLKDQMKKLQAKAKEASKANDTAKIMEINSKMMGLNGPLMKESFKSMIYTLIPSLLILAWMSANLAFMPIVPNQSFNVIVDYNEGVIGNASLSSIPDGLEFINGQKQEIINRTTTWQLKSPIEQTYTLTLNFHNTEISKDVMITNSREYINPIEKINSNGINTIKISNKEVKPFEGVPIFGGLNWLWTYILITLVVTSVLRKALKVY